MSACRRVGVHDVPTDAARRVAQVQPRCTECANSKYLLNDFCASCPAIGFDKVRARARELERELELC